MITRWGTGKLSKETIIERLNRFKIVDGEHWRWNGNKSKSGYGKITILNTFYRVHRLSAYLYLNLDLHDNNQQALHKLECKLKDCWNPEHLYVGTQKDNMQDLAKARSKETHFKCGHEKSIVNTRLVTTGFGYQGKRCKFCEGIKEFARDHNIKINGEENEYTG